MITPNVNAPGMIPAGAQEITSVKAKGEGKEEQSFMDVLSIADSASRARTDQTQQISAPDTRNKPQQTKDTKGTKASDKTDKPDQTKARDTKDVKQDDPGKDSKEVTDTSKSETRTDRADKADGAESVKVDPRIEAAAKEVAASVGEVLDISDEELTQVMETLGLVMTDLLDPKAVVEVVAEVKDVTPVDIVSDEELSGIVTDLQGSVREITSDLIQEMDITPEEFKNTLAEIKTEYEVVSPESEPQEETQDLKTETPFVKTEEESPKEATVRTPAEAVRVVRTETPEDRTGRISEERDTGRREVDLEVRVRPEADNGNENNSQSFGDTNEQDASPDNILRSEGRARRTEAHADETPNNNSIFFQNLNTAVENTLEAAAAGEVAAPGSTAVDAMDLINQINSQIRAVVDNETQSLSMQLHPQSLGRLNVELVSKAGQLTAQFEAEDASVKAALETRIAELKETLEQRGIRVESVEVTVASHEFEQNLMGGEQSGNTQQDSGSRPGGRTRSINLNDLEALGGDIEDIPEDERIARDMMAADGNSVDYMA